MSWFAQIQIKTVFLKLDCVQRLACDRRSVYKGWRSWEDGVRRPILKAMTSSEWKRAAVSIDECRWWRKVATDEREREREREREIAGASCGSVAATALRVEKKPRQQASTRQTVEGGHTQEGGGLRRRAGEAARKLARETSAGPAQKERDLPRVLARKLKLRRQVCVAQMQERKRVVSAGCTPCGLLSDDRLPAPEIALRVPADAFGRARKRELPRNCEVD